MDLIDKVKQGCKCCSTDEYKCNECPYWAFGVHNNICTGYVEICADALSVIEQLEQEIKRLKAHKPDCDHAEHDSGGCLGYGRSDQDDEPIDACKKCEKYTGKDGENE